MAIITNHIDFTKDFTQIPNAWLRDERISRRARGLLAELLSHREGWQTSIEFLVNHGTEGKDAIRSAVKELVEYGYLMRVRPHSEDGRFTGSHYVTCNPDNREAGFPTVGESATERRVSRTSVLPESGESATKNTNYLKNTKEKEHQNTSSRKRDGAGYTQAFETFWKAYPRKQDKGAAFKAWKKISTSEHPAVIAGAERYANDPNRVPQYTKHGATWLNARAWEDETPLPAREQQAPSWARRAQANIQMQQQINQYKQASPPKRDWKQALNEQARKELGQ